LSLTVLSQTFSQLFDKIFYNISKEEILMCMCVRYLVVHVTDNEPSVHIYLVISHLKLHCSYRDRMAVPAHCCTLSQTLHGTQNKLRICTEIESNMEQKRYCGVFALPFLKWKSNKYFIFRVRESRQLSSTQSALWPVRLFIIFHIITQTARSLEKNY
jgi:hypothetical protein